MKNLMKKRILSLLLAVVLVCSLVPTAFAASSEATDAANTLHNLGLFNGTGTNADGTPIYDLDRAPSRFEAVTMLVRLLGKDAEAKAGTWDTPFTDVVDWAKPYVGYAYANGLTAGTSTTTFGGSAIVTASQYLTFVLRSLGYESGKDFQWDKAWELSDKIGMTDGRYNADTKTFLRSDVAIISNNALYMNLANNDKTLLDSFNARGFGMLEQNDKTMNVGGDSIIVEIDGKYHDNAPLTMWAYEFNGKISYYTDASNFQLLKILTKDYKLQPSQSANPKIEEALEYDMSQTSRVGISKWNAYPAPGVSQTWATYSYRGNMFSIALDNGGHDDNVLYYVDGVRCFDRVWDGKQYTFVNVDDFLSRFGLKTEITFKNVEGINEAVWTFTDVVEFTPTPLPTPTTPEDNKENNNTPTEDVPTTPSPDKEVSNNETETDNSEVVDDSNKPEELVRTYPNVTSINAVEYAKIGDKLYKIFTRGKYGDDFASGFEICNSDIGTPCVGPYTFAKLVYLFSKDTSNYVSSDKKNINQVLDGKVILDDKRLNYTVSSNYEDISLTKQVQNYDIKYNGKNLKFTVPTESFTSDEAMQIQESVKESTGLFNNVAYNGFGTSVFFYIDELIEYFGITDADLIEKLSNIKIETIEGLNFIVIK